MRYFELGLGNSVEEDWETFDYSICIADSKEMIESVLYRVQGMTTELIRYEEVTK